VIRFLLNIYLGHALVTSAVLPAAVSPIIAARGLVRFHAAPGAYPQSFQYEVVPEVFPPSGKAVMIKNMPRHLLQVHCR